MNERGAIIDWVSCTFFLGNKTADWFLHHLSWVTGLSLIAKQRRSRPGFTDGVLIQVFENLQLVDFAVLAWGGESQRGRAMLDMSGSACGCISDWRTFQSFVKELEEVRLTRVDLALDFHDGEYTVDQCKEWYEAGAFTLRGRAPSSSIAGDWLKEEEGRTIYIGKSKNGKMLRCYEKGKQLGDKESSWVRFEVQLGNRDREIPLDILSEPSKYFVASYPVLEHMIDVAGESIKTISKTSQVSIGTILKSLRLTYGKWLNVFQQSGLDMDDLIEELRVREIPKRIHASAVVADVLHQTIHDAYSSMKGTKPCNSVQTQ